MLNYRELMFNYRYSIRRLDGGEWQNLQKKWQNLQKYVSEALKGLLVSKTFCNFATN